MGDGQAIGQALRSAIMHCSEPMVLSDPALPDNPMVAVNRPFELLTGYSRSEVVGRNCRFLQGAGTDPETPKRIGRCLREGHGCIEWIVNHRKDGSPFWNLLFISPVFDRDGGLRYFFGNQQDISRGAPGWLEDFSIGKAHMSAEVEAEFHRLLLAILEDADSAETAEATAERSRALERIVAATRRLADMTTRLAPGGADGSR